MLERASTHLHHHYTMSIHLLWLFVVVAICLNNCTLPTRAIHIHTLAQLLHDFKLIGTHVAGISRREKQKQIETQNTKLSMIDDGNFFLFFSYVSHSYLKIDWTLVFGYENFTWQWWCRFTGAVGRWVAERNKKRMKKKMWKIVDIFNQRAHTAADESRKLK